MRGFYILDDNNNPVESTDLESWRWETANPERLRVGWDEIGEVLASTVFTTRGYSWIGKLEVFETMVFGGERGGERFCYETWDAAKAGHDRVVAELKEARQ